MTHSASSRASSKPLYVESDAVAKARSEGKPLVALESTIITHGMPFPQNVETARAVENVVRAHGAEPVTIAVLDGQLHIGLNDDELDSLAQAKNVMKLSRADFAYAISAGRTGSTTVAATMIATRMAGIPVFATGGIGGVHRGAETSFDISADLQELANTDVIVVCAGAKAILDIPKTLEVLETLGVPTIVYGSDELPAFWSRSSGLKAPLRLDTPQQIADHALARAKYGMKGGTLIANPVPAEHEIDASEIAAHIEAALRDAHNQSIAGKEATPFLLGKMLELTGGQSLKTNIALVENNARLAAQIAVALTKTS
ncbi:MAG: pseudouridine-5'-phosphate glycosidase [Pseudomonadota bacterium]